MPELTAKDIVLRPIDSKTANEFIRRVHYSGKVAPNSQLHIGVYLGGRLEGALQFGPSLDKRKIQSLVLDTGWNEFVELNRLAFTDVLPRNSESRALSIAMKFIRKHAPHVKWIVSFADAAQCGDGTIYRASGFALTGITHNNYLIRLPSGEVAHRVALNTNHKITSQTGGAMAGVNRLIKTLGGTQIDGFQLRYIYFLDPTARERLTVPILPFSEIERRGAGMYRGKPRAESIVADVPTFHVGEDGSHPISALHTGRAERAARALAVT